MTTLAHDDRPNSFMGWLRSVEAWLDDKGKGAWIALLVVGFIAHPIFGLTLLAYMIWSKKMICSSRHRSRTILPKRSTGNAAFDSYRSDTLRRLEEEQHSFEAFLQRLRDARDKAEFDDFMNERAAANSAPSGG